jgi:acetyl-CoA carboxylase biotin carboxylase subunit
VTELVTGVDLVADQIVVAAGEDLPYREASIQGWALECRIAAEDPFNNFLPSVGTVSFVSVPGGPGVRVDSALYDGLEISYHYDPLIAKLCTWGRTRMQAIQRMRRALREFKIVGISTNIPFHLQVLNDTHFLQGKLDTSFVEKRFDPRRDDGIAHEELALVAAAVLAHRKGTRRRNALSGRGRGSRWRLMNRSGDAHAGARGWRRST